ncbi:hypothetical protein GCM10010277_63000 [Streptomyces longisporoflavus]|uniref:hypothetical protein n=1 Tax=Streptomyces longisporoflavus TaxID=28044 RepID=UPI00167DD35A|nr:hypothetical protein [Streptomyces longisporoflavus]GGV59444.1 hypothetical protein GCM10010277_63000 [Streptomyces longisporoflavus]
MDADWWARGIAIGAAGAATTNVIFTGLTYRRVRPKVKVRLFRTGLRTGTDRGPDASEYQFVLRFTNDGTTPVSVERIELVSYPRWFRTKSFTHVKSKRFEASDPERPLVPAVDGTTARFYLPMGRLTSEELKYLRFQVLLSNGDITISPKVKTIA